MWINYFCVAPPFVLNDTLRALWWRFNEAQMRACVSNDLHPLRLKYPQLFQLCLIEKTWVQRLIVCHDFKLPAAINSRGRGATWRLISVTSNNGNIKKNNTTHSFHFRWKVSWRRFYTQWKFFEASMASTLSSKWLQLKQKEQKMSASCGVTN